MTRRTRLAVLLAALAALWLLIFSAAAAGYLAGTALAASRPAPLVSPILPGDADDPPPDSSLAGQARGPESVKRTPRPLTTGPDPDRITSPSTGSHPALELQSVPEPVAASTPAADVPSVAGTISGVATWFDSPAGVSAAGPALRAALGPGWRGQTVRVCTVSTCIVTMLGDWCACPGGRVIDLHAPFFAALAPLSVGIIRVRVTPIPAPPETSTP